MRNSWKSKNKLYVAIDVVVKRKRILTQKLLNSHCEKMGNGNEVEQFKKKNKINYVDFFSFW